MYIYERVHGRVACPPVRPMFMCSCSVCRDRDIEVPNYSSLLTKNKTHEIGTIVESRRCVEIVSSQRYEGLNGVPDTHGRRHSRCFRRSRS